MYVLFFLICIKKLPDLVLLEKIFTRRDNSFINTIIYSLNLYNLIIAYAFRECTQQTLLYIFVRVN